MKTPFDDSIKFMRAVDHTTGKVNFEQFKLYLNLIDEEWNELHDACEHEDGPELVEILDALIDILVVTIGAGNSLGFHMQGAWDEVMRSNFAKVDPITGKVKKRADGKVLKPESWTPPNLRPFVK
jgi:predicted HAD superfamily Cof-like phosphohydrolase